MHVVRLDSNLTIRRVNATTQTRRVLSTLQLGKSWFPEQAGGGLDRVYYALTRHLGHAGVHVRGIVAGSQQVRASSGNVVRAFASEKAPLLRRMWGMRQAISEARDVKDIDLIASHFALYTFPVLDLLAGRPLVVHFHGPWAEEGKVEGDPFAVVRAKAALERLVYRRGTRFIVLSDAFRKILQTRYGVAQELIRVIPGGVEVDHFDTGLSRGEARARLGWPADRPVILSVRRLARRMGLENLIDAMRTVRSTVPDALLYIAGKGPLAPALAQRIAEARLERHVKLLGFVPEQDLPLVYRAADFSVVPTVALEGFGLITIESLAAGTPVFVTPQGGLPEVVRGLSPALIFESHQVQALSRRLVAVLRGQLVLPTSAACQAYARAYFDWPVIASQTRKVYEEVLA